MMKPDFYTDLQDDLAAHGRDVSRAEAKRMCYVVAYGGVLPATETFVIVSSCLKGGTGADASVYQTGG